MLHVVQGSTFPLSSVFYENSADDWHAIEWKVLRLIFLTQFKLGPQFDCGSHFPRRSRQTATEFSGQSANTVPCGD